MTDVQLLESWNLFVLLCGAWTNKERLERMEKAMTGLYDVKRGDVVLLLNGEGEKQRNSLRSWLADRCPSVLAKICRSNGAITVYNGEV